MWKAYVRRVQVNKICANCGRFSCGWIVIWFTNLSILVIMLDSPWKLSLNFMRRDTYPIVFYTCFENCNSKSVCDLFHLSSTFQCFLKERDVKGRTCRHWTVAILESYCQIVFIIRLVDKCACFWTIYKRWFSV